LREGGIEVAGAKEEATAVAVGMKAAERDEVIDPADRTRQVPRGALDAEPALLDVAGLWVLLGVLLKELGDAHGDRLQGFVGDRESKDLVHMG
jgi:hypothetical protein